MISKLLNYRHGIGFKVGLSMIAVASMTIMLAGSGFLTFQKIADRMRTLVDEQVGELETSASVVSETGGFGEGLSKILLAKNDADLTHLLAETTSLGEVVRSHLAGFSAEKRQKLLQKLSDLEAVIEKLALVRRTEFRLRDENEIRVARLNTLSKEISDTLEKQAGQARVQVALGAESAISEVKTAFAGMVEQDFQVLQVLLEIRSEVNMLSGVLISLSMNPDAGIFSILQDLREGAVRRLKEGIDQAEGLSVDPDVLAKIVSAHEFFRNPGAFNAASRISIRSEALTVQQKTNKTLAGAIDDLVFELTINAEEVSDSSESSIRGLLQNQVATLTGVAALNLRVRDLMIFGLQGLLAEDETALKTAHEQMLGAAERLRLVAVLDDPELQSKVNELLSVVDAKTGIPAARQKVLASRQQAAVVSHDASATVTELTMQARALGEATLSNVKTAGQQILTATDSARMTVGIMTAISIFITVAAITVLYFSVVRPLVRVSHVTERLARGKKTDLTAFQRQKGEIGAMVKALGVFRENQEANHKLELENLENLSNQTAIVEALAVQLEALAQGDLIARLNDKFPETYEELRGNFNSAVLAIETVVKNISSAGKTIDLNSQEIRSSVDDLAKRTETMATTLKEASSELNELTESVQSAAQGAAEVNRIVASAKHETEKNTGVVVEAIDAMSEISESSKSIARVIDVIDDISFQTNLLALNAGVEAARAGDAGRGFAVVATEVSQLAQNASKAAEEISGLISKSNAQVDRGVKLVGMTGDALEEISNGVTKISDHVNEIANSSEEQSGNISAINSSIAQLEQVAQNNAAIFEQTNAAVGFLHDEAQELSVQISKFKVGHSGGEATAKTWESEDRTVVDDADVDAWEIEVLEHSEQPTGT